MIGEFDMPEEFYDALEDQPQDEDIDFTEE
jgi:hypothetical protein